MSKEAKESVVATIELPAEEAQEIEIQQEVGLVETRAKEMIISTDAEYEQAAEFGQQIKIKAKVVTDFFRSMKDAAYQAHKAVCDREKTILKPLQDAEKNLKKSMAGFIQEKESKRKELEAKLQKDAQVERERMLNEAAALESEGKVEEAEAAFLDAQVTESVVTQTMVIMDTPKVRGISSSQDWEIESIHTEIVPINFAGIDIRPVDEKAVLRLIKASKGSIQIPGIKYKETIKMSFRR